MKIFFLILVSFLLFTFLVTASVVEIEPKLVYAGEELTLKIDKNKAGIYKFLPIYYNKDLKVADVIELDCEDNRCFDKVTYKYIVDLEPASYFIGAYDFNKGQWEEIDFFVEEGFKTYVNDDLSEINNRPRISPIPDLVISLDDSNLTNILDFNQYSIDSDNDALYFSFLDNEYFLSDIIGCEIQNSFLSCDKPKKIGEITLTVKVNDKTKEDSTSFKIIVKDFVNNRAPIAMAGEDKIVTRDEQFILDASASYDPENNIPSTLYINNKPVYSWFLNENLIGAGKVIKYKFSEVGTYDITLKVRDSASAISEDTITINVLEKEQCKNTKTVYYPKDTVCQSEWLSKEGKSISVNTRGYSCDLIEVCNEELDPIIEEAINCCSNHLLRIDSDRAMACDFAKRYSDGRSKRCEALYLIQGLGSKAIYMQDYFEAEMCCYGVKELCTDETKFFLAEPFPNSNIKFTYLKCETKDEVLGQKKGLRGWWSSDIEMDKNNIALSDVPTHVSINYLSTGTCVDYSFALVTLLRKAGYVESEILAIESEDHAFNLVKLSGDEKFTVVDATANNYAMVIGGLPFGYEYCGKISKCYNDLGQRKCPDYSEINGCENFKETFKIGKLMGILIIGIIFALVLILYFGKWRIK